MNLKEISANSRIKKWTAIIADCKSSGQTVVSWCRDNNISIKTYYYWYKKVMTTQLNFRNSLIDVESANARNQLCPTSLFAEIPSKLIADEKKDDKITIRIGMVNIDVPEGTDIMYVSQLIKAVHESC